MKYYEAHVTIEPVFDKRLQEFREIAQASKFQVADLLMQKDREATAERSDRDSFCTGRGGPNEDGYQELFYRGAALVHRLRGSGFDVWRYKIEAVLFDERLQCH